MVNCLQLTEISETELLREENISYFLPAHSEIVHFYKIKAAGSSVKLFHQYNLGVHIGVHIGDYMPYNWL